MIKLRDAYKARDAWSESQLKETFEFKNKKASVVINDCNYWSFGDLPVGITDSQGPLTTALSIVGYENFCYWIHDYPGQMHELMELVTEGMIRWIRFQKERAGSAMDGCSYPLGIKLPEEYGGVWLSDDDSIMISADMFKEFVVPYNSKVLKAFDGGCIHYCGDSTQNIENYCNTEGLRCIHNLNIDNITAAAKMKEALGKKGIPYVASDFVPSDERLESYYRELFDAMGDPEGLIVASYVAPAMELDHGKYEQSNREQFELGKTVRDVIASSM